MAKNINTESIKTEENAINNQNLTLIGNEWKDISNDTELYNKLSIANSPYFQVKEQIEYFSEGEKRKCKRGEVLKFEGQLPKYLFLYYKENIIVKISLEDGFKLYEEQKKAKLS